MKANKDLTTLVGHPVITWIAGEQRECVIVSARKSEVEEGYAIVVETKNPVFWHGKDHYTRWLLVKKDEEPQWLEEISEHYGRIISKAKSLAVIAKANTYIYKQKFGGIIDSVDPVANERPGRSDLTLYAIVNKHGLLTIA